MTSQHCRSQSCVAFAATLLVVATSLMSSSHGYSVQRQSQEYQYQSEEYQYQSGEYQYQQLPYMGCQCAMFLVTSSDWYPEHKVFATGEQYSVNCSLPADADKQCKEYCEKESASVSRVYSLHPEALEEYPPSSSIPCSVLPAPTATFYQSCGPAWIPLLLPSYTHVCCHPITQAPAWCDAIPSELFLAPELQRGTEGVEDRAFDLDEAQERGLDLDKSPDDIENNEIEGSTKPEKHEVEDNSSGSEQSWLNTMLSYFGYKSIAELVQGFDIFSLPQRFRKAVKTYRDEMGMGQCYMEYTTYSIFTKGENPFEAFLRSKRSVSDYSEDVEDFVEDDNLPMEARYGKSSSSESKQAQIETIKSLVGSMVSMLEQSDSTKRYASVIRQLLPVVTQVYAAEDPQQAVNTLVSSVLGPYLEKMNGRKPKPGTKEVRDKMDKLKSKPSIPAPPPVPSESSSSNAPATSSPMANILLNLVRQYMGSYFNSLPGGADKTSSNDIDSSSSSNRPSRPSAPLIPGNLMNLVNLFLGGASRPRPQPTRKPTTTPVPKISEKIDNITEAQLGPPKDFADVVLEVIRPVFISILGKAPGDSGVASIREVSRLSVLGRVDDTLAEEVLSPYFCLKTYGVNKAWTLTETTLRNFVTQLSPEERESMRALLV